MDVVSTLTEQLGIDQTQAKGLAGGLLGLVKAGVEQQHVGSDEANRLEAAMPEIQAWQAEGDTPEGQPGISELLGGLDLSQFGGLGGLGSALEGMMGSGGQTAGLMGAVMGMVQKFGLDAGRQRLR